GGVRGRFWRLWRPARLLPAWTTFGSLAAGRAARRSVAAVHRCQPAERMAGLRAAAGCASGRLRVWPCGRSALRPPAPTALGTLEALAPGRDRFRLRYPRWLDGARGTSLRGQGPGLLRTVRHGQGPAAGVARPVQ